MAGRRSQVSVMHERLCCLPYARVGICRKLQHFGGSRFRVEVVEFIDRVLVERPDPDP